MISSKRGVILFILILSSFLFLVNYLDFVEITGYSILNDGSYTFNFSDDNYTFNNSIVLDGGVKLNNYSYSILNSTVRKVVSAIRDGHEDIDKVISLGNGISNVDKEELFDISFDELISNGDVVRVYIFGGEEDDLWLCDKSTFCDKPGYGLVHYIRSEDQGIFYNITVSGLSNPVDGFNFDPKELKFDYIEAIHNENNTINKYYNYGEIETNEVEINGTIKILSVDEELNEQIIEYYYSVGGDWININPGVLNLSVNRIKLKAILRSNREISPILNSMSLDYEAWVYNETGNITLPDENQTINPENETLPDENNTITNQTNNETVIISNPSSSGGGGGGGSSNEIFSRDENVKIENNPIPIVLQTRERKNTEIPEVELIEKGETLPTGYTVYIGKIFGNTEYNAILLLILSLLMGYSYRKEIKWLLKKL